MDNKTAIRKLKSVQKIILDFEIWFGVLKKNLKKVNEKIKFIGLNIDSGNMIHAYDFKIINRILKDSFYDLKKIRDKVLKKEDIINLNEYGINVNFEELFSKIGAEYVHFNNLINEFSKFEKLLTEGPKNNKNVFVQFEKIYYNYLIQSKNISKFVSELKEFYDLIDFELEKMIAAA